MMKKLLCLLCFCASIQKVTALEKVEVKNIQVAGLFSAVDSAVGGALGTAQRVTDDVVGIDRRPILVEKEQIYRPAVQPDGMIEDEYSTQIEPGGNVEDYQGQW